MVALRIENLNPEVSFSPHRSSISLVERQSPQIAGSEDFIPLESFSVNPLTTKLLWKHPKPDYSVAEYLRSVGRNPKGNRSNTNITLTVLESYGVNSRRIPDNLIPVVDQALRNRARDSSKTGKTLQDIYRKSGHKTMPSSEQRKVIKRIGVKYGISGKYWNVAPMIATAIVNDYKQTISTARTRGWETRRANKAAREIAENERIQQVERNKQALTEIYETGYNRIVRFIAVRIGNIDEAQNLASEVFVRALGAIDSYENRGTPMEAWINTIARNLASSHKRDRGRRRFVNIDEVSVSYSGQDLERIERLEGIERVRRIMQESGLNSAERQVLALRFSSDMTFREIGEAIGKTEGAAKASLHRALTKLRDHALASEEMLA